MLELCEDEFCVEADREISENVVINPGETSRKVVSAKSSLILDDLSFETVSEASVDNMNVL